MDADSDSNDFIEIKRQFKHKSDQEKLKILEEKDKASTQKATAGVLKQLKEYLLVNKLPKVDELTVHHLADILYDFYPAIKPQKGDNYSVQSLKCIRSALATHFRAVRGIDITKDSPFVKCNEMFKAVTVHSKSKGKGYAHLIRRSHLSIWRGSQSILTMTTSLCQTLDVFRSICCSTSYTTFAAEVEKTCMKCSRIPSKL